jgi:hypothetical protein
MRRTLRAMDWKPPVQGGNGRPSPEPQRMLAEALGWATEVVVRTRMPRGSGYPTCYKMDIADPELRIAIEVDGSSHQSLKIRQKDAKKASFLVGLGWTVLRFSNQEVTEHLEDCVREVSSTISRLTGRTPTSQVGS